MGQWSETSDSRMDGTRVKKLKSQALRNGMYENYMEDTRIIYAGKGVFSQPDGIGIIPILLIKSSKTVLSRIAHLYVYREPLEASFNFLPYSKL